MPSFMSKVRNKDGRHSDRTPSPNPSAFSSSTSAHQSTTSTDTSSSRDMYSRSNPSVTVVPPSPSSESMKEQPPPLPRAPSPARRDRHAVASVMQPEYVESPLPTPTPARTAAAAATNGEWAPSASGGSPRPSSARPLTPSSSAGNLRQAAAQSDPPTPPLPPVPPVPAGLNGNGSAPVHRTPSGRSQTTPASLKTGHLRAATSPATYDQDNDGNSSIFGSPDSLIAESPTERQRANSDALSDTVSSIGSGSPEGSAKKKEKKGPWRRGSLGKKRQPTGLAAALAASGMAMANPTMQGPLLSPNAMASNNSVSAHSTVHKANASVSSIDGGRRGRSEASFDDSDDEEEDEEDESASDLEQSLRDADMPVTGFAVASRTRNADFHELFPSIPEADYLIEDYGCALQRDILVQGRIYISENHICFHANIFGWITDLSVPIYEITSLEKRMTALIIPNAIQITTRQNKYVFASFLSRDTTFDVIHNIWRLARPDAIGPSSEAGGSARQSLDRVDEVVEEGPEAIIAAAHDGQRAASNASPGAKKAMGKNLNHKPTQCSCSKDGRHYTEKALEIVIPGTPDKIYNLMFASGFMKDFMRVDQKLMDVQISDWCPVAPGSRLLTRNMSYIKPLSGSLGPKQTKCELKDEAEHCDFDDYVVMITTTRTPDVPSGGVFSVKTRTCLTWASAVSTKVLVTTQVEWTGRSFIKGIIEKSAIDGQKVYHADLDKAMRTYIQEHQTEFVPAGVDPAAVVAAPAEPGPAKALDAAAEDPKARERERNRRGLQWAWDTFEGASEVAVRSTKGALELVSDAWEQSTSTTILIFLIVGLVLSNLWTLTMMGKREELGRMKERVKTQEREKWVQGIVTALWDELAAGKAASVITPPSTAPVGADWRAEFREIEKTLDAVEDRVRQIRESIKGGMESLD